MTPEKEIEIMKWLVDNYPNHETNCVKLWELIKIVNHYHESEVKNLNISDVIKRLSEIQRYNMVEGGNSIHRLIHAEKNDNGEWIHYSVIDEITKMLKQINVL